MAPNHLHKINIRKSVDPVGSQHIINWKKKLEKLFFLYIQLGIEKIDDTERKREREVDLKMVGHALKRVKSQFSRVLYNNFFFSLNGYSQKVPPPPSKK